MRVLLVVGSAPCLHEDLAQAEFLYPDAEKMLVNGACIAVKDAEHMLCGHTGKSEMFIAAREKAFPGVPIRVHANTILKHADDNRRLHLGVTDWWGAFASSGATSAGKAALIGIAMGFDRIILCGCPMDFSGYFPGESEVAKQEPHCHRIGDPRVVEAATIRRYRETMADYAKGQFAGKVYSMSGFTRDVLGGPPCLTRLLSKDSSEIGSGPQPIPNAAKSSSTGPLT